MKVNEMLVVLGGKDLILRRAEELPDDVIQVKDPLIFLSRIEMLSSAPEQANGNSLLLPRAPAQAKKKAKKKAKRIHKSLAERDPDLVHSVGKNGPRIGYYRITPQDVNVLEQAVIRRDAGLSNFQLSALRMRFGFEGETPKTLTEIAEVLLPDRPDQVSREIKRAIRVLGIKRAPRAFKRRRNY